MGLKGVFPTLTIRVSSQMPPLETRSRTYKQEARLYELQFHAKMCVSWEGAGRHPPHAGVCTWGSGHYCPCLGTDPDGDLGHWLVQRSVGWHFFEVLHLIPP